MNLEAYTSTQLLGGSINEKEKLSRTMMDFDEHRSFLDGIKRA